MYVMVSIFSLYFDSILVAVVAFRIRLVRCWLCFVQIKCVCGCLTQCTERTVSLHLKREIASEAMLVDRYIHWRRDRSSDGANENLECAHFVRETNDDNVEREIAEKNRDRNEEARPANTYTSALAFCRPPTYR